MNHHYSDKATAPVVCLDSGIGGLHIFKALAEHISAPLLYIADYAGFPYGDQPHSTLCLRLTHLIQRIQHSIQPSLIILACNTATTVAIESLRSTFPSLPFVGCVPAIKPAATQSQSGYIALLATSATCQQPALNLLIQRCAPHCTVLRFPLPSLAPLAEAYFADTAHVTLSQTRDALKPLLDHPHAQDIDHVVLGCTHYRFLLPLLEQAGHPHWTWVDSSEAVALQAYRIWSQHCLPPSYAAKAAPLASSLTQTDMKHPCLTFLYTQETHNTALPPSISSFNHLPSGLEQLGLAGLTPMPWHWLTHAPVLNSVTPSLPDNHNVPAAL